MSRLAVADHRAKSWPYNSVSMQDYEAALKAAVLKGWVNERNGHFELTEEGEDIARRSRTGRRSYRFTM